MRAALAQFATRLGASLVIAFGFFLVASNILLGVQWTTPEFVTDILAQVRQIFTPPQGDAVANYVLFTHVDFGERHVTTGVQYISNSTHIVDFQWCYLSNNEHPGEATLRLPLATVSSEGIRTIPSFTSSALAQLDLSEQAARDLVQTHCRFQ